MLTIILLSINILVAILLIIAVLLQKSEGGALGMGGGPSNFMSARGTGDLLTRITWILFGTFLFISITLTLISASHRKPTLGEGIKIDPSQVIRPKAAPATTDPAAAQPDFSKVPVGPAGSTGILGGAPAPVAPTTAPEKK